MNKDNIVDALISDIFSDRKSVKITVQFSIAIIIINGKEIVMENGQVTSAKYKGAKQILTTQTKQEIKRLLML